MGRRDVEGGSAASGRTAVACTLVQGSPVACVRRWRRGYDDVVAAVVPESSGEDVGEGEKVAAELTVGSIWAEKGRRGSSA